MEKNSGGESLDAIWSAAGLYMHMVIPEHV